MAVNFLNLKQDKNFYIKLRAKDNVKNTYARTHARKKHGLNDWRKLTDNEILSSAHLAY